MDEIVVRILSAMKDKGLDQKTLAKEIGVRPQAITEWKTGVTASYTRYIQRISELLGVSADYLLTGDESLPAHTSESSKEDDPLWDRMRELYMQLPPQKRVEAFEKFIKEYSR